MFLADGICCSIQLMLMLKLFYFYKPKEAFILPNTMQKWPPENYSLKKLLLIKVSNFVEVKWNKYRKTNSSKSSKTIWSNKSEFATPDLVFSYPCLVQL